MNFVVMGIDRVGKDTFIEYNLPDYRLTHLSKPPEGEDPLRFSKAEYCDYFLDLKKSDKVVYNRGHIDEFVYAPMYRDYGTYWLEIMEQEFAPDVNNTWFVLLLSRNFSVMEDDGQSLDYERRQEEQELFEKYFDRSRVANKMKIYTISEDGYRGKEAVRNDFLAQLKEK